MCHPQGKALYPSAHHCRNGILVLLSLPGAGESSGLCSHGLGMSHPQGKGWKTHKSLPAGMFYQLGAAVGFWGLCVPSAGGGNLPTPHPPGMSRDIPVPITAGGGLAGIDETLGVENNLPKSWRIGTAQNGDGPGVKNTQFGVRDTPAMDTRDVPALGQNPPNLNQRSPVFKPKFFHI